MFFLGRSQQCCVYCADILYPGAVLLDETDTVHLSLIFFESIMNSYSILFRDQFVRTSPLVNQTATVCAFSSARQRQAAIFLFEA